MRESVPLGEGTEYIRRVAGKRDGWRRPQCLMLHCFVVSSLLTPSSVCHVAVPCGFAWPLWKVRLRESVPLGGTKTCWCIFGASLGSGLVAPTMLNCTYSLLQSVWPIPSVMWLCHGVLRGHGGKCVCVSPCHWGEGKHAGVYSVHRWGGLAAPTMLNIALYL